MQLLTAVAGSLLKKCTTGSHETTSQTRRNKVVVVPYLHNLSHSLGRIGRGVGVDVVFSAPLGLPGLCARRSVITAVGSFVNSSCHARKVLFAVSPCHVGGSTLGKGPMLE
uniref:Tick transposon n=1 Tax=Rhipicephalus appendiculatus TaxID=34631 RepID=A0A131YXW7_RHIAP